MNLSATALRLLIAKGLTLSDVADFVEANDGQRSSAAIRQKRYRDNKRNERDVTRDVTPSPNERDNLTPTREKNPSNKLEGQKVVRGARLSADWEPRPLTGKALAMVAAWQPGAMERELAKFKNYWLSKGANAARTDWQRTWINWLITADERQPRQSDERRTNGMGRHQPASDGLSSTARAAIAVFGRG